MKYIIHACPERLWYVQGFIIPSMLAQGINAGEITIYCDDKHRGVLFSTMESFQEQTEDAWHLQDDILISSRFREVTLQAKNTIYCGYCSDYIQGKPSGMTNIRDIWYSSPCIFIPREYANECANWFYDEAIKDPKYQDWIEQGKYDDEFFKIYMIEHYPSMRIIQLKPNLVEHVDYLIGGSTINKDKQGLRRSKYWVEPELVEQLEIKLKERQ